MNMEATYMDKQKLIRTIVTVAPVFLVPLITERKRIKEHPDVKCAADATGRASKKVAHKSVDFKEKSRQTHEKSWLYTERT